VLTCDLYTGQGTRREGEGWAKGKNGKENRKDVERKGGEK